MVCCLEFKTIHAFSEKLCAMKVACIVLKRECKNNLSIQLYLSTAGVKN